MNFLEYTYFARGAAFGMSTVFVSNGQYGNALASIVACVALWAAMRYGMPK